jgi:acetolactate synthase-1/2/3 large subunit
LIRQHVTDAFGVPGGVVLELIYAMDARKDELTPHLSYHEQAAGFAACGYAQASGHLGVAYATRGPGFTNLISAMADAYCDSLPVLFITGHSAASLVDGMRVMDDQEMDTVSMVRNITKYAARIDDVCQIEEALERACHEALNGRKGPVFLDIATSVMKKDIEPSEHLLDAAHFDNIPEVCKDIQMSIRDAERPIILVGDGVNQAQMQKEFRSFIEYAKIPVISSRFSHDIMGGSEYYFGYVGSHGIRTANFVLSKADLIVAMGNRMHYPVKSESFGAVTSKARVIRLEVDGSEFNREVPNATNYQTNLTDVLCCLNGVCYDYGNHEAWMSVCSELREELQNEDVNSCVESIVSILEKVDTDTWIVNDVGNNEFYVSRASVLAGLNNRVLYSKSFGALGCGLGKAIGTYYATHKPVVCFVGDQGLQMNIQELQYIAQHKLPIAVVLLNNQASGMIKDRETIAYKGHYVHTTKDSGYGNPEFKTIALAYGIDYCTLADQQSLQIERPLFVEVPVDDNLTLSPNLPRGAACQDLYPQLERAKYEYLNSL